MLLKAAITIRDLENLIGLPPGFGVEWSA